MKFIVVVFLVVLCLGLSECWTLSLGGTIYDGKSNRGCTNKYHAAGKTFEWDRGVLNRAVFVSIVVPIVTIKSVIHVPIGQKHHLKLFKVLLSPAANLHFRK